ncbi:MAG: hypothetical protein OEW00_08485 [candidate division Zixibacteria bacterium]|nr:hypothetical protein [candidate division Zixibacteria bacterium]
MTHNRNRRMQFVSDKLIEQIVQGKKTAGAALLIMAKTIQKSIAIVWSVLYFEVDSDSLG